MEHRCGERLSLSLPAILHKPGGEQVAVTLRNLKTDLASFVFIADESPLHRKLGVYENRG